MLDLKLQPPLENILSEPLVTLVDPPKPAASSSSSVFDRKKSRQKWTDEETELLMEGCRKHGVGAWKKILSDPALEFQARSAVDLKDRFRTAQPEEYQRLYPNSRRLVAVKRAKSPAEGSFRRVARRPRNLFSKEEDDELFRGVTKHGCAWAKIAKDGDLKLTHRRSTDLRDRFRNAFPDYYAQLGYVPKPRSKSAQKLSMATGMPDGNNQIAYHQDDLTPPYASPNHPHALPHIDPKDITAAILAAEQANFSDRVHNAHQQHHYHQFSDLSQHNRAHL